MPQVFKSRRNILRAANKSKREHFTAYGDGGPAVRELDEAEAAAKAAAKAADEAEAEAPAEAAAEANWDKISQVFQRVYRGE